MATSHSYLFNNMGRLGEDRCYVDERSKQNTQFASYTVSNPFASTHALSGTMHLATAQPSVFVKGGFGTVGAGGHNVDQDSALRLDAEWTNPKVRLNLNPRMFVSVPYLGKGKHDVGRETRLQWSEATRGRKSTNSIAEQNYLDYHDEPLLPSVRRGLTNTAHYVEQDASEGWVRGGMPSREFTKM